MQENKNESVRYYTTWAIFSSRNDEKKNIDMIEINEFDYFQQRLWEYIDDYHPYKIKDDKEGTVDFVVSRSILAYKSYFDSSYLQGLNGIECMEIANNTLFTDLHFSPITYLIEICIDLHGYEMDKDEACDIYSNQKVRDIFEKYGQDIEGDDKEYLLIEELEPYLKMYEGKGDPEIIARQETVRGLFS